MMSQVVGMLKARHVGGGKKHWIGGAVKHPGALTNAAARHGVSKLQEAKREEKSSNPHIRSRGFLGERFIKKTI